MFEFAWLWVLLALPAPLLVYRLAPRANNSTASPAALKVPFFDALARLGAERAHTTSASWLTRLAVLLIWAALVASAARPQWVGNAVQLPASGRDLLLAVDISGSMDEVDMRFNDRRYQRIDVVKFVVGDFVERRQSDRLGLILFGTHAYLQAPLTFDRQTVNTLLQEAQLGFAGPKTAIGDAIGLAIKRLRDRPASSRVLILLTDGANTAGEIDPRTAADLAKTAGIKIYTIGVGADEMIRNSFIGPRRVNPSADLDEASLMYIASTTGGRYFRARNPSELADIYSDLDRLEPVEQETQSYRPVAALYHWPLAFALMLSMVLAAGRLIRRGAAL